MDDLCTSAKLAYGVMYQSRDQLVAIWDKDHEIFANLVNDLLQAEEDLKTIAGIVRAAHLRMLISASAAVESEKKAMRRHS